MYIILFPLTNNNLLQSSKFVVNLILTVFILLSLVFGQPIKILYGDTLCWILSGCFNFMAIKQVLGGFFISIYRIICMKMPKIAMNLESQRKVTNQLLLLELITTVFFLGIFYLGRHVSNTEVTLVFFR